LRVTDGTAIVPDAVDETLDRWRSSLTRLLASYEARRARTKWFVPRLFLFFTVLNAGCYWLGLLVAYPEKLAGLDRMHYVWLQFPVGLLGAVFDTASFFVTVAIIRRALRSRGGIEYVAHLSIDAIIAVLATFWVLLVFSISGWILSYFEASPELLGTRNAKYEARLVEALHNPRGQWRNIYFGLVMGVSASLPTLVHVSLFARALLPQSPPPTPSDDIAPGPS